MPTPLLRVSIFNRTPAGRDGIFCGLHALAPCWNCKSSGFRCGICECTGFTSLLDVSVNLDGFEPSLRLRTAFQKPRLMVANRQFPTERIEVNGEKIGAFMTRDQLCALLVYLHRLRQVRSLLPKFTLDSAPPQLIERWSDATPARVSEFLELLTPHHPAPHRSAVKP